MSPNPRPMTLTDLRIVASEMGDTRPATLKDLAEVLKSLGAVKHRPFFARMSYKGSPWRIDVPTDGSYIVWRTDQ